MIAPLLPIPYGPTILFETPYLILAYIHSTVNGPYVNLAAQLPVYFRRSWEILLPVCCKGPDMSHLCIDSMLQLISLVQFDLFDFVPCTLPSSDDPARPDNNLPTGFT